MLAPSTSPLLRPRDLCNATPDWALDAVMHLTREVMNPQTPFPCHFATQVYKNEAFRATFVDEPGEQLGQALREYIGASREIGPITSFLAFFRPSGALTDAEYQTWFWSVLQDLHDNDPEPWPADIPQDIDDPNWAFCYGGQAFFVVCFTPAHHNRRSRRALVPMIIFQPRWIFNGLEGSSTAGQLARKTIRDRVQQYDTLPPSVNLTSYGEGEDWKQYFLLDRDDSTLPLSACPFSVTPKHTGASPQESTVSIATPSSSLQAQPDPRVVKGAPKTLDAALAEFLPPSGVIKLVREVAFETTDTHTHPTPETLFIIEGTLTFSWGEHATGTCYAGDRLLLPPNVVHASAAGPEGCFYLITDKYVDAQHA